MYGCQCTKRLHLHKYRPELKNPVNERVQFVKDSGNAVGLLAQQLFPGGADASPADTYSYQESVIKTQELIAQGACVIYEAVFQYQGVLCALDMLVKEGNEWHAYEVKGTARVKEQHVQDAAFQYYVITHCGIPLEDISIVHLNNQYIRKGELDVQQLFKKQSILKEVVAEQSSVQRKIELLRHVLAQPQPETDIGPHCFSPYECDFTNHCFSHMPKVDSIFDLVRGPAWELYQQGYRHLDDIPPDYELNASASHQLAHYRSGEAFCDKQAIQDFLADIHYPVYFLDFETVWPGVPEFDGTRPFQQIPFQFSLHVQRSAGDPTEHYEFLGDGKADPRETLATEMIRLLGSSGSILCYNASFEKTRIKELAKLYPQYQTLLHALTSRVEDLMTPFQKRLYYHPEFKGRYSIKNVLPVLCPDLRYDTLAIQEGDTASKVYAQLKFQDDGTAAQQREHLLAYCKMDTLAMVKVLEWLRAYVLS